MGQQMHLAVRLKQSRNIYVFIYCRIWTLAIGKNCCCESAKNVGLLSEEANVDARFCFWQAIA